MLKIIAFGDIHMAVSRIREIPGVRDADLLLLTGDLTNCGGLPEAEKVVNEIKKINPDVLALFGNMDRPPVNDYLEEQGINLHGQAHLFRRQIIFIGAGGSNRTPFNTPSEFSESQLTRIVTKAHRLAAACVSSSKSLQGKKIPLVLVSHVPPFNTGTDMLHSGRHVGSRAIRSFIELYRPDLCICGHIHESKGMDHIGDTPVYNSGMLKQGGWLTIQLNQSQLRVILQ